MFKWASENLKLMSERSIKRFVEISKDIHVLNDNFKLRKTLLDFIADFSNWDNSIEKSFIDTCCILTLEAHESISGISRAKPIILDPFAGGGSIPLEALRVGADAIGSDLNPIPVLLNKVLLEFIPQYKDRLSYELRKWGKWVKNEALKKIGEFYPIEPDGNKIVAYLWARTVFCEGPNCGVEIPLMRSLWLSKKKNRSWAFKFSYNKSNKRIDIELLNNPKNSIIADGTVTRGAVTCPVCGYTTTLDHVKKQFLKRRGGTKDARMVAVVISKKQGKLYRLPQKSDIDIVNKAKERLGQLIQSNKNFIPNEDTTHYHTFVNRGSIYGLNTWDDYFTYRQNLTLGTLIQLIQKVELEDPGLGKAIRTLLSFAIDRGADYWSSLATWAGDFVRNTFGRQALPFVWDFAEVNPFSDSTGNWLGAIEWISRVIDRESQCLNSVGQSFQANAADHPLPDDSVDALITDPPYYYAIQYADLSDYFYVWLKRSLLNDYNHLFSLEETPKQEEAIVQSPGDEYRKGVKNKAHYENIMTKAFENARRIIKPNGIAVIVFANATTDGWEAILKSLINTGWVITGSWPIDTERPGRVISSGRSVLSSSIHLACRPRECPDGLIRDDDIGDWSDVLSELPKRIHEWMPRLAEKGVVGADAIFSCLGPALEIFSRFSSVEKASGEKVELREYLEQVWAAVAREALNMIFEGADASGFEEDSRLTAMWLWTLRTNIANGSDSETDEGKTKSITGYMLEYDAARKIAQGLGAHLENLKHLVETSGDKAILLSANSRASYLFGKDTDEIPKGQKKKQNKQMALFEDEIKQIEEQPGGLSGKLAGRPGTTVLDQLHQTMLLFGAGRSEALKRFLVEDGAGNNPMYWRLAQSLSALYPSGTDEKRWVDGILARKKSLGF